MVGDSSLINVTKPFLPPLGEVIPILEGIWQSRVLSNSGPVEQKLEVALKSYLGVENLSLVNNGTIGLLLALKAAKVKGEVITTPYSFVATSNIIEWCGLKPVFVDVSERDFNIDPDAIRSAITENTSAILGTHCYGNPCDVQAIEEISKEYDLPVIYDGCHAFGVRHLGQSLLNYGDFAVVSFHATKVFNTFEGGAVISRTAEGKRLVDDLKNFGIQSEIDVSLIGLNGKMSEFNAAVGLAQLPYMATIFHKRAELDKRYRTKLSHLTEVECLDQYASDTPNYPYFPIKINRNSKVSRDKIVEKMRARGVNPRRYFYPLITNLEAYKEHKFNGFPKLSKAEEAAASVICLPLYPDLSLSEQDIVIETLINSLNE